MWEYYAANNCLHVAGYAAACAVHGGIWIHGGHLLCYAANHQAFPLVACTILHTDPGDASRQLHQWS